MLYLSGIFITFFLAVILISKKGKMQSDKILAAWLSTNCLHFILFYLYTSGNYIHFPYLLGINLPLPLMYGPFLFLYAASLTGKRKLNVSSLLHFIPAASLYVWLLPYFFSGNDEKIYVVQHEGIGYEALLKINLIAIIISGVSYILLTLLLLRRFRKNIENEFSNTDKINLNWLRYLTYGTSVIWLVILSGLDDQWIFTTAAIFVFFLGFFGIRQVGIFDNTRIRHSNQELPGKIYSYEQQAVTDFNLEFKNAEADATTELAAALKILKVKYQKSTLTEAEGNRIHNELGVLMAQDELFRNPELNLAEVAGRLKVHPNILSQVINTLEKKSFYDYINSRRVEEFKKKAQQPGSRQWTLLALAFDCGFNSKTAFNRNFRKSTGITPSEFLSRQHLTMSD